MNIFGALASVAFSVATRLVSGDTPSGFLMLTTANRLSPVRYPDLQALVTLYLRGEVDEEHFKFYMRGYGFDATVTDYIISSAKKYLDVNQYITLYRRGEIDRKLLDTMVTGAGVDPAQTDLMLKATEYFPNAADLIRFAVREVYSPEIIQKYGLFEDLPPDFLTEAEKAGVPPEIAKLYWGSHWELPSPMQGFEMLHRRVISKGDLKTLLRTLDIVPYWRDKLIEISYNPLTRVDVRRMYGMGVLNEQQVYEAYLDIGYNEDNARRMTEFTVRLENSETTGVTRANAVKGFVNDLITRQELIQYLKDIGYSDKVIHFWVAHAEYEKTEKYIDLFKKDLIIQYRKGDITLDEIRKKLLAEDLPSRFVERFIKETILEEGERRQVPTKTDLQNWLMGGIIEEKYYVEKMRLIGYTDTDIQNYLTEVALKQDTSQRKFLVIATYVRWLSKGILTESQFTKIAGDMGYSSEDIERLITEAIGEAE